MGGEWVGDAVRYIRVESSPLTRKMVRVWGMV